MDPLHLPEKVLTQQICSNCEQYLSVGPVTISPTDGRILCGRCPKDPLAVKSLYNIIAEKCLFKCVNHCKRLLLFTEAKQHERACRSVDYECPFCKYKGRACQLLRHFRKFHTNHIVQGDTFEQIISYKDLNVANFISEMNNNDLRVFVNAAPKLFINCVNCEKQFTNETVYVCPKFHPACVRCCKRKCPKCDIFCHWNSKSKLHSILLECEWENCYKETYVFTYMTHKQVCKFRQYKCPDEDCAYTCNLKQLKKHWHMSPIETKKVVDISSSVGCYWLIPEHNELLYVTVDCDRNKREVTLVICEINCVLPFNLALRLVSCRRGPTIIMPQLKYSAGEPCRYIKCVCDWNNMSLQY